ncbi:flagellar biosynthesis protein FlgJ [Lichenibacterium minor]|uniref:Flagellar biosynthesis protein FlgJ n=1 Tax=Lichenibacterium minor TaxID=2316528 RepID=A0A4Q2U6T5_9HYPH|nr:rod-binding protein [Lichenibacterium minor]RYC32363.1 flagellar biosynthesis protein FlgJ [Lichenibacterium minor]
MSIAPPSDIILDVAQAADPRRLQAATTKLNTMATSSGGQAVDFHALLASAAAPKPAAAASPGPTTLFQGHAGTAASTLSPYQKFEAVLLQTFVQEILPKDDKLFGDAASADAYRGMMAEQLANQLARSGRIGIARMIEKAHGPGSTASAAAHAVTGAAPAAAADTGGQDA